MRMNTTARLGVVSVERQGLIAAHSEGNTSPVTARVVDQITEPYLARRAVSLRPPLRDIQTNTTLLYTSLSLCYSSVSTRTCPSYRRLAELHSDLNQIIASF